MSRARGALLGLAVGDALGTTLEFTSPRVPALPMLLDGPHREIIGRGPFKLAAGQVTDDTQMACCLATSLRACGRHDADDAGARYVAWVEHSFDIGSQTITSLTKLRNGEATAAHAGRLTWLDRDRRAAGNGSLMRCAPIGVRFAGDPAALIAASLADSAITHFDPRCQLACAAFNAALAAAVSGGADERGMAAAARAAADVAAARFASAWPDEVEAGAAAREGVHADLTLAASDDPDLYGEVHLIERQGFVRVAFRLAFWHLLHTRDVAAALIDIVNRGGDADTNGAIAGALLGAAHGEDALPAAWRRAVLDALQTPAEAGPLASTYHPRELLRLTDAV